MVSRSMWETRKTGRAGCASAAHDGATRLAVSRRRRRVVSAGKAAATAAPHTPPLGERKSIGKPYRPRSNSARIFATCCKAKETSASCGPRTGVAEGMPPTDDPANGKEKAGWADPARCHGMEGGRGARSTTGERCHRWIRRVAEAEVAAKKVPSSNASWSVSPLFP